MGALIGIMVVVGLYMGLWVGAKWIYDRVLDWYSSF
jgi:hypothetical protein